MRIQAVLAALIVAVAAIITGPKTADAGGLFGDRAPAGWGTERTVRHYVYAPRYRHSYRFHNGTDPYAYRYEPRGYYPYYNSGYWRPRHTVKKRHGHYKQAPYYQAWGDNRKHYKHRKWHKEHHGRHRLGHW
ncbi:MAG: hypothetical protein AAFV69_06700 [Pseudomonadota bacterium]